MENIFYQDRIECASGDLYQIPLHGSLQKRARDAIVCL